MPTELTPAPYRYAQQFPIALEHPKVFAKMFGGESPSAGGQRPGMNMGLHQYQHQPHSTLHQPHPPHQPNSAQSHRSHIQIPQHHQSHQTPSSHSHSHSHHPPPFLGHPSLPQPAPPSLTMMPMPMPVFNPHAQDSQPNKCLPNGVRNVYAPYAGEAYMPGSEKADRMAHDQTGSPFHPVASLRSHHPNQSVAGHSYAGSIPISIPIPVAHRGSLVSAQGWAVPGSVMGSMASSFGHGGMGRVDEGWNGSQGREHMGHMPDPTSTAGRLGRTPEAMGMGLGLMPGGAGGSQGWRQAPSSWQNHARLTPGLVPSVVSFFHPASVGGGGGVGSSGSKTQKVDHERGRARARAGSVEDRTRPRRTSFVLPGEECSGCSSSPPDKGVGLKRAGSGRSTRGGDAPSGNRQRRLSVQAGQAHSPIVNSPLTRIAKLSVQDDGDVGLRRKKSGSAKHSPGRGA